MFRLSGLSSDQNPAHKRVIMAKEMWRNSNSKDNGTNDNNQKVFLVIGYSRSQSVPAECSGEGPSADKLIRWLCENVWDEHAVALLRVTCNYY